MKKHAYVLIPFAAALVPLILTWDSKVAFFSHLLPWFLATLAVGLVYLVWDALVVIRGHWKFNDEFVGRWRFFHLPLGEYLFFFLIPYACIFLYETGVAYFGSWVAFSWSPWYSAVGAVLAVIGLFLSRGRGYSQAALLSVAVFFALQGWLMPDLIGRFEFLWFLGLSTLGFLIVDGLYTSLPTIFYNPKSNWGLRIFTIPAEDFLYNLSHLGLILLVYLLLKGILA